MVSVECEDPYQNLAHRTKGLRTTAMLTEIQNVYIRKRMITVTPAIHEHLAPNQIGSMIALLHRSVPRSLPFLPRQFIRIRYFESPDVVQGSLPVSSTKDDQKVFVVNRSVGAALQRPAVLRGDDVRFHPFAFHCSSQQGTDEQGRRVMSRDPTHEYNKPTRRCCRWVHLLPQRRKVRSQQE
jgi:hypothetical protein